MDNLIAKIYKSRKTVFTTRDLMIIWNEKNLNNLKSKISYYVSHGALIRLTRGVFAIDNNYELKELATSIYSPSYISFETVLRKSGVIFQYYKTIYVASRRSKGISLDGHKISFRKLKDIVLYNPVGVEMKENYSIASRERAFLDTLYLFPNFYFDNLDSLDWEKCLEIAKIYNNKMLIKRAGKYFKEYAE